MVRGDEAIFQLTNNCLGGLNCLLADIRHTYCTGAPGTWDQFGQHDHLFDAKNIYADG